MVDYAGRNVSVVGCPVRLSPPENHAVSFTHSEQVLEWSYTYGGPMDQLVVVTVKDWI